MGSTIVLTGSGAVTTDFMRVAGFPNINFNTSSTSAWGNVRMRVAMALDSHRLDGRRRQDAGDADRRQEPDRSIERARQEPRRHLHLDRALRQGRQHGREQLQRALDRLDRLGAANGTRTCTNWNQWGNCTSSYWTPANHNTWTGCLTDRDQNYDTLNTTPTTSNTSTLFPAEEYTSGNEKYCKSGNDPYLQPIMPLSYNWTSLKTLIDNMEPTGMTNQGIGLAWAWMTLGTGAPFNAPAKDPN